MNSAVGTELFRRTMDGKMSKEHELRVHLDGSALCTELERVPFFGDSLELNWLPPFRQPVASSTCSAGSGTIF